MGTVSSHVKQGRLVGVFLVVRHLPVSTHALFSTNLFGGIPRATAIASPQLSMIRGID